MVGRGAAPATCVALELDGPVVGSWAAGLPDDAFEHDGQLTKRDLRAGALARLAPQPGQLLWDVGAGAGSVGIEWMRAHPTCRAIAVEADPERAARIGRNAAALGVPGLEVVHGRAPEALADLPDPDAVFVGGGATAPGCSTPAWRALRPGGRLVVHGVTLETEALLADAYAEHGGELTRHSRRARRADRLASPAGRPARAVTQWACERAVTVHFVGAGPGAADLLTLRAADAARRTPTSCSTPAPTSTTGVLVPLPAPTPSWSTPRTSTSTRSWPGWSTPHARRARRGAAGLRRPVGLLRARPSRPGGSTPPACRGT